MVAEAEQVQLERLALHHAHIGHVGDVDGGEVRLAGDGAQARELRAVELHEVVVSRVLVLEGLQHRRIVVGRVLGVLVAEQGDAAGAGLALVAPGRGSRGGRGRGDRRRTSILASQMGRDGSHGRGIHRSLGLPRCIIIAAKQRFSHIHWFHLATPIFFTIILVYRTHVC